MNTNSKTRRGGVIVCALGGLFACGGQPSKAPIKAVPEAPTVERSQPTGFSGLPKEFSKLGTACESSDARTLCADGRLVAVRMPWDTAPRPTTAEVLVDNGDTEPTAKTSMFLAIDGPVLWARRLTCGDCRRQMGFAWVIDLSRLDARDGNAILAQVLDRPLSNPISADEVSREAWLERIESELAP